MQDFELLDGAAYTDVMLSNEAYQEDEDPMLFNDVSTHTGTRPALKYEDLFGVNSKLVPNPGAQGDVPLMTSASRNSLRSSDLGIEGDKKHFSTMIESATQRKGNPGSLFK
jgi:hypothetical protein